MAKRASKRYSAGNMGQFSEKQDYAPLWKRGIAMLMDALLILAILYILLLLNLFGKPTFTLLYLFFISFIPLSYFVISEALHGQTPGKRIMGIIVIKGNGNKIGFKESFIRNIVRIVDALPFFYIFGIILILSTSKKQRLGDLAAKTVVIQKSGI